MPAAGGNAHGSTSSTQQMALHHPRRPQWAAAGRQGAAAVVGAAPGAGRRRRHRRHDAEPHDGRRRRRRRSAIARTCCVAFCCDIFAVTVLCWRYEGALHRRMCQHTRCHAAVLQKGAIQSPDRSKPVCAGAGAYGLQQLPGGGIMVCQAPGMSYPYMGAPRLHPACFKSMPALTGATHACR